MFSQYCTNVFKTLVLLLLLILLSLSCIIIYITFKNKHFSVQLNFFFHNLTVQPADFQCNKSSGFFWNCDVVEILFFTAFVTKKSFEFSSYKKLKTLSMIAEYVS